jgi:DNA-binding NarL/FixJ family response regulator
MQQKIRILIVEDQQIVRYGVRSMLCMEEYKYNFVLDEAETGEEGIRKSNESDFDIILMDYQLPQMSGPDAVAEILKVKPNLNILAFSSYNEFIYAENMMKAGAKGYVLKNISREELLIAFETILQGKTYYSNEVATKMIDFKFSEAPVARLARVKHDKIEKLSPRETEILRLIASEYTNEQIANKLFISKRTVDTHRQNLLKKLDVKNTAGLMQYAYELKEQSDGLS